MAGRCAKGVVEATFSGGPRHSDYSENKKITKSENVEFFNGENAKRTTGRKSIATSTRRKTVLSVGFFSHRRRRRPWTEGCVRARDGDDGYRAKKALNSHLVPFDTAQILCAHLCVRVSHANAKHTHTHTVRTRPAILNR